MNKHFSSFYLNTFASTAYFESQVPKDYPVLQVLSNVRRFRDLPPNLRRLSALAKRWQIRHSVNPQGFDGIEDYYDDQGHELDPATGERLTPAENAALWPFPKDPGFKVEDIPVPRGGFADPDTWEPWQPVEEAPKVTLDPEQLKSDVASHGIARVARDYGMTPEQVQQIIDEA